jgi:hypothetical protein
VYILTGNSSLKAVDVGKKDALQISTNIPNKFLLLVDFISEIYFYLIGLIKLDKKDKAKPAVRQGRKATGF